MTNSRTFRKVSQKNLLDPFKKHQQKSRVKNCLEKLWLNSFKQTFESFVSDNSLDDFAPFIFSHTDMLFCSDHCYWIRT